MPNPDNNPNRTDDDELREDVRYMYHLMERYKGETGTGGGNGVAGIANHNQRYKSRCVIP